MPHVKPLLGDYSASYDSRIHQQKNASDPSLSSHGSEGPSSPGTPLHGRRATAGASTTPTAYSTEDSASNSNFMRRRNTKPSAAPGPPAALFGPDARGSGLRGSSAEFFADSFALTKVPTRTRTRASEAGFTSCSVIPDSVLGSSDDEEEWAAGEERPATLRCRPNQKSASVMDALDVLVHAQTASKQQGKGPTRTRVPPPSSREGDGGNCIKVGHEVAARANEMWKIGRRKTTPEESAQAAYQYALRAGEIRV